MKQFNDSYKDKNPELFSVSDLDWMDEYGEQELKKRLIANFKGTKLLRYFVFFNTEVFVKPSFGENKGMSFIDGIYIKLSYSKLGPVLVKINKATGIKKYLFNFNGEQSAYSGSYRERIIPDFDMSEFKKYMK